MDGGKLSTEVRKGTLAHRARGGGRRQKRRRGGREEEEKEEWRRKKEEKEREGEERRKKRKKRSKNNISDFIEQNHTIKCVLTRVLWESVFLDLATLGSILTSG